MLSKLTPNKPETQVVAAIARAKVVAVGRTQGPGATVQTAAATKPVRARIRPPGIALVLRRISAIPVPAPLPHVPAHVIEAQLIGSLPAHRMGTLPAVTRIPAHFIRIIASCAKVSFRGIASTGSILPFGLRGQPVPVCAPVCRYAGSVYRVDLRPAGLRAQPVGILRRSVPTLFHPSSYPDPEYICIPGENPL